MNFKTLGIWFAIAVAVLGIYVVSQNGKTGVGNGGEVSYSQLLKNVDNGEVKKADINGDVVKVEPKTGKPYNVNVPPNSEDLVKRLEARGSTIVYQRNTFSLLGLLFQMLPILLLIGVWIFFMRQMQGGTKGAMGFGKSKARLLTENKNRVLFDDVALDVGFLDLAAVDVLEQLRIADLAAVADAGLAVLAHDIDAQHRHRDREPDAQGLEIHTRCLPNDSL